MSDEALNTGASPLTPEICAEFAQLKPENIGDPIGPYRLVEEIGEGGFGTVWMADQERPVRRRVALKIIKPGMDTKEVIARFEQERQALAMMEHPNIAKVFDAGTTQWGRPFFVMELVRGIKITDYCDHEKLSTPDRLQLFVQVCNAVQHAHLKGIIHRDLKPSNILVTMHDGVPVPKIIDFGISKATAGRMAGATTFTQINQFIGTPAYMSPEQAEMDSLDIDTRSDIYSLGVLLYELLVGKAPFDPETLLRAGLDEMRRVIREQEPPKPSTALQTMAAEVRTNVAHYRQAEGAKLAGQLRGDLDWIVMKALEKDRTRRYETANGFAEDIRRYLANEPVTAAAPGVAYLFGKFVRRNKAALSVAALIVVVLLAATGISVWQAKVAIAAKRDAIAKASAERTAREESEAITTFLIRVFESPDPARDGRTITVAETLGRAARQLDTDLASQPVRRARLLETVGHTYVALWLGRDAISPLEKARDLRIAAFGPEHPETLTAMAVLADALDMSSRQQDAFELRRQVLELRRKALGPEHRDTLTAMHDLAVSYHTAGLLDEALELQEKILPFSRKVNGPDDPSTLRVLNNLASYYFAKGRRKEAHTLLAEALPITRKINGPKHPATLLAMTNLATSLDVTGHPEDALKMREEILPLTSEVNGEEHADTLRAMNNLGVSYSALGRVDDALKLQEKILPLSRAVLGPNDPDTLGSMTNLAVSYRKLARFDEAIELQKNALEFKRLHLPKNHPYIALAVENMADCYRDAGRLDEERAMRAELELLRSR